MRAKEPNSQHPLLGIEKLKIVCLLVIVFGCLLRFFEIFQNSFIFYDEGMYLGHNADLLDKIGQFPPKDSHEFFTILRILFISSLTTAKWLWFFISSLRVFFDGPDAFYFTRVVSALCGVISVWLTYVFARKIFLSRDIAYLSAAILAVLPSHVFYSRLAMQESFCTLFFLAGIYFYCSHKKVFWRLVLSGIFLSAVYFTNYRMIVLPALLVLVEGILSLSEHRRFGWVRLFLVVLTFGAVVLFFGLLNHGSNLFITTAWMGRQAEMAAQPGNWLNVFSFPYAMARLEGGLFFLAVFLSVLFVSRRKWLFLLPVGLVIIQMAIFTFASEKGARYLCVVLPFAAMAAALCLNFLLQHAEHFKRWVPPVIIGLFFLSLLVKSLPTIDTPKGYQHAISYIRLKDPHAKILATQPIVVGLISGSSHEVAAAPKDFRELLLRYAQGYRYLIIDPQAYVSWTQSGFRFTSPLVDYLGFIKDQLKPEVKFRQLNNALTERFVFDHNENLPASIRFLKDGNAGLGDIYVYDLSRTIAIMQQVVQAVSNKPGGK